MTAKDKAIELSDKFLYINDNEDLFCDECGMSAEAAKQCALIAVDEILNIYQIQNAALEFYELRNHWQDVKQELLKL